MTAEPGANQLVRACSLADLPDQGTLGVELQGIPIVLVKTGEEVFALSEFCTHEDVSLVDGEIYDHTVECWLHGSCFDVRSGTPTGPPATRPLATYQVSIDGDDVYVALPSGS